MVPTKRAVCRTWLNALVVALVVCVSIQRPAVGESLPTSGTFEGVYHQDRWGVGHFGFFIVHPALHAKLAPFDGKLVRLKVTGGTQPMNPGPAVMLGVDEITELPRPPLDIRFRTRPSEVRAGQPFQLIVELTNRSTDGAVLSPGGVFSAIRQPYLQPAQKPNDPSHWFKEYTVGQLSTGGKRIQMHGMVGYRGRQTFQGRVNLNGRGGRLLLLPGASWAWVAWFPKGLSANDAELNVHLSYALTNSTAPLGSRTSQGQFELWHHFDVSKAAGGGPAPEDEPRLVVSDVELPDGKDGWTDLQFNLSPAKGKAVRVPGTINRVTGQVDAEKYAHIARLEGIAADGSQVELEGLRLPDRGTANGIAQLVELPETGAPIRGRFRKVSRFAPALRQVVLRVMTDQGIVSVALAKDFKDKDVSVLPPFGPTIDGVEMRIRPAKEVFKVGEPLVFHVQARNVSGKPVCWWKPSNGLGENVIVEIDGRRIEQPDRKAKFIVGWSAKWTCKYPDERTVKLPDTVWLAKGRHTLRYINISHGGKRKNVNNEIIPIVRGRIQSNKVAFSVE